MTGSGRGNGVPAGRAGTAPACMSEDAAAAVAAAAAAGSAVMGVYATDFEARAKEDDSPLTEADLASHRVILRMLAGTAHPVLSEEGGGGWPAEARGSGGAGQRPVWIVDPLDGTADFVGRTGEFTVMISLVGCDGRPAIGVINCPASADGRGTMYAAQSGAGAFRQTAGGAWERVGASREADTGRATAVVSRNHLTRREQRLLDALKVGRREAVGSSLKACRIAEGTADIYLTYTDRMHVWDTAASECILAEAGGAMTDMDGGALRYHGPGTRHPGGILATNGLLHDAVLRQVRASAESP